MRQADSKSSKPGKRGFIGVRVARADAVAFRQAAADVGLSMSEAARRLLIPARVRELAGKSARN